MVADVDVVAQDFLSLNLEGLMVTDDVFCAFMVDDPDGIGKGRENEHANNHRRVMFFPALFSFFFVTNQAYLCFNHTMHAWKGNENNCVHEVCALEERVGPIVALEWTKYVPFSMGHRADKRPTGPACLLG